MEQVAFTRAYYWDLTDKIYVHTVTNDDVVFDPAVHVPADYAGAIRLGEALGHRMEARVKRGGADNAVKP